MSMLFATTKSTLFYAEYAFQFIGGKIKKI